MRKLLLTLFTSTFLFACDGPEGPTGQPGAAGPPGPSGPIGATGPSGMPANLNPSLSTVDKLVAGLGGREAVERIAGFALTSSGSSLIMDQGFAPGDSSVEVSRFSLATELDVAAERMRLEWRRRQVFAGGVPLDFVETISGDRGYVTGVDNLFMIPSHEMSSLQWAATTRRQRLLNPQLIVKEILADPSRASSGGLGLHDGVLHELLVVRDDVHPLTLWVHPRNGRVAKLSTTENSHLHRDSVLEVHYSDWRRFNQALLPADVLVTLRGQAIHFESRSDGELNPTFAAGRFDFPAGTNPSHEPAAAEFALHSHSFYSMFSGLGIPAFLELGVRSTTVAPGVYVLNSGNYNSMVIEQANGLVLVEAPLYPERSEVIIAWAASRFPGRAFTHAIATHHHMDHSGGLRAFVARGATIVASEAGRPFLARIFRARSTIVPDALERGPRAAVFRMARSGEAVRLEDPLRPVIVHQIDSPHAADAVVIELPSQSIVFNSDLWSPGLGELVPGNAAPLLSEIRRLNLRADTLVGGHGGVGPLTELVRATGG